jgi:hypothetical protein
MKALTKDLIGAALDWAVARCEYDELAQKAIQYPDYVGTLPIPSPSTDWSQGGAIILREGISVVRIDDEYVKFEDGYRYEPRWIAATGQHGVQQTYGPQGAFFGDYYQVDADDVAGVGATPLIAAMRCYVASKLGGEVDTPEKLA